jgi:hypothetical protein
MAITGEALGATVDSVDALSTMLGSVATTVNDTKPVLEQVNSIMGETLPSTLSSATSSLQTAQQAAAVLDSAIQSLDSFRTVLAAAPLVGAFVEQPSQPYNPEVPLAESLGELAASLEDLPDTFSSMSENLNKADDNLDTIQTSLVTMADNVSRISGSLGEYQAMVNQSKSSMDNIKAMLTSLQANLNNILNAIALVLSLFFLWLLAAQVVILSQGWELYQGTADRMEAAVEEQPESETTVPA